MGQGWIGGRWWGESEGKGQCYIHKQRACFVHAQDQMKICQLHLTLHGVCVFTVRTVINGLHQKTWNICTPARRYEQINVITVTPLAFLCAHENCKHTSSCTTRRWRYTGWLSHVKTACFNSLMVHINSVKLSFLSPPSHLICTSECWAHMMLFWTVHLKGCICSFPGSLFLLFGLPLE